MSPETKPYAKLIRDVKKAKLSTLEIGQYSELLLDADPFNLTYQTSTAKLATRWKHTRRTIIKFLLKLEKHQLIYLEITDKEGTFIQFLTDKQPTYYRAQGLSTSKDADTQTITENRAQGLSTTRAQGLSTSKDADTQTITEDRAQGLSTTRNILMEEEFSLENSSSIISQHTRATRKETQALTRQAAILAIPLKTYLTEDQVSRLNKKNYMKHEIQEAIFLRIERGESSFEYLEINYELRILHPEREK